ncbi:MAG: DUF2203 domain-containing protein [Planctomycetaceae bacterium]
MSSLGAQPSKLFTIEQANAMLPLVRAITADLSQMFRDVADRKARLSLLLSGREIRPGDPYSDELADIQSGLDKDQIRLQIFEQELRDLGLMVIDARSGVIGFPAIHEERVVVWSWKLGEVEVCHFQEVGADSDERQSLIAGVGTGSEHGF